MATSKTQNRAAPARVRPGMGEGLAPNPPVDSDPHRSLSSPCENSAGIFTNRHIYVEPLKRAQHAVPLRRKGQAFTQALAAAALHLLRIIEATTFRKRSVHPRALRAAGLVIALLNLALYSGCSVKKYAINQIGNALSEGSSVYENDEDIYLVGDALPFGLKLIETLLAESPNHRGLLLTACRGFVLYSYAYVDFEAERAAEVDLDRARLLRTRARKLYLRALQYGFRGLEISYPDFENSLTADPAAAVVQITNKKKKRKDLPFLYWTAGAMGLAISVSRNDARMLARIPEVEAMLARAAKLDEDWDQGSLHEFQMILASAKPGPVDEDEVRRHYRRAVELSEGKRAAIHTALAEAVAIPNQDREEFDLLIERTLAVDPEIDPDRRLVNLLAHRRARWLRSRAEDLILDLDFENETE